MTVETDQFPDVNGASACRPTQLASRRERSRRRQRVARRYAVVLCMQERDRATAVVGEDEREEKEQERRNRQPSERGAWRRRPQSEDDDCSENGRAQGACGIAAPVKTPALKSVGARRQGTLPSRR